MTKMVVLWIKLNFTWFGELRQHCPAEFGLDVFAPHFTLCDTGALKRHPFQSTSVMVYQFKGTRVPCVAPRYLSVTKLDMFNKFVSALTISTAANRQSAGEEKEVASGVFIVHVGLHVWADGGLVHLADLSLTLGTSPECRCGWRSVDVSPHD